GGSLEHDRVRVLDQSRTDPVLNTFYDWSVDYCIWTARRVQLDVPLFTEGDRDMSLSSIIERTPSPTVRPASVRLSRQFSAVPERVFDAWLNADEARTFLFACRLGNAVRSEIDPRVGGGFKIVCHQDGEDVEYSGEYLEIDRPNRLVFSLFVEKYAQRDDR